MCRVIDMKDKEVINTRDGARYGYVCDVEVDICTGKVVYIIVPYPCKVFSFGGREQEYKIPWCDIQQIGEDLIIVDVCTKDVLVNCHR